MNLMRRVRVFGIIGATVTALVIGGAAPVAADGYGNGGGNVQLYQATASANCDNVSLCGADHLGGFWAWAVFNADGTVQGEVTNCGHLTKAGAPGLAGAQHFHIDGHYAIIDFGLGPWIVITSETDTASGGFLGTGTVVNIPSEFTPVGPAAKAHLSLAQFLFGFSGPGVTFNVTVTPMHVA